MFLETLTHRITSFVHRSPPVFSAHGTNLRRSSPVTTDDPSCFNASWLSINTGTADFLYIVHDQRSFQKATCSSHRDCGTRGHMVENNWIFELTAPPHFRLKVVCKKGGCIIASLRYYSCKVLTSFACTIMYPCVSVTGAFCLDCYCTFTCSHTRTFLFELVVADESHKV